MYKPNLILVSVLALFVIALVISCTKDQEISRSTEPDLIITPRTVLGDSVFQSHNDFIMYVFDNYYDSLMYFKNDPEAFFNFAERRSTVFTGAIHNISDVLIDDDELILPYPYYEVGEGFTTTNDAFSQAAYDSIYVILDSLNIRVNAYASEASLLQVISRGKNRVISSSLPKKDEVLNLLNQAKHSVQLAFDLEEEFGGDDAFIDPCVLIAVCADINTYNYFAGEGDTTPGDPMYGFAMTGIRAVSMWAFVNCN